MKLVFDIEANGLIKDASNIWCISVKDIESSWSRSLVYPYIRRDDILDIFREDVKEIIGHNIIGYDIPMLKKFYGIDLISRLGNHRIADTYLYSQVLYPDRPMPKGCPTSILNPITNKLKKVGPHSLEAWGWRVGHKKIEIHDWLIFTPEIVERCEVDVDITTKTYLALLKEAGLDVTSSSA